MKKNGFIKTKVCFDDYYKNDDPNLLYDAFIHWKDKGWNGWANPYLLQKDRDKLIGNMISAYSEIDETVQGLIQTESQVIDGVTVYDFGGCYCWNIEDDGFKKKKMDIAFGPDFMESEDKGDIKHYGKETFEYDTIIVIDRTEVNLKGYDYYRKDDHYYLSEYDLPKLKESISASLYELALDGQGTLIFNDEDFLESDDIYALLSEHFNYKIDFGSMSKKELKTFIQDLLDGKTEYFLNDDFPKEVLITFLRERG